MIISDAHRLDQEALKAVFECLVDVSPLEEVPANFSAVQVAEDLPLQLIDSEVVAALQHHVRPTALRIEPAVEELGSTVLLGHGGAASPAKASVMVHHTTC